MLSHNLEKTLHRALTSASEHRHTYATLEHLLWALVDDRDASTVLRACSVKLGELRDDLSEFIEKELSDLVTTETSEPKPTAGFQRVVQRAAIHVQSNGHDDVTGADVLLALFRETESHTAYFLHQHDITQLDVANFLRDRFFKVDPPPIPPSQGSGPHVELTLDGVIAFSPPSALDTDGNHLPRLHALHPELCELARALVAAFGRGNAPHAALGERVAAYAALIDRDLHDVDFRRFYAAGVRLANVAYNTEQAIMDGDLPPLGLEVRAELDSLLALHGSFIMATEAGSEALMDEERYRRLPAEERQLRADAVAIAAALQNRPDLVAPDVAEQVLSAAQEMGEGRNPERSTVVGRATLRNVIIAIAGGAIGNIALSHATLVVSGMGAITSYIGLLTVNESVKKTQWFQRLTGVTASTIDKAVDAQSKQARKKFQAGLRQQKEFVIQHEDALSKLARERIEFEFLGRMLRWIKEQTNTLAPDERE